MTKKTEKNHRIDVPNNIHEYYLGIINSLPNIVYWTDIEGNLQGCNHNFVNLLGLKSIHGLSGKPYEQMTKSTAWSKKQVKTFQLDDIAVLFSGKPQSNIELPPLLGIDGTPHHYIAHRTPLFDQHKQIIGLVVVLTDNNKQTELQKSYTTQLEQMQDHDTEIDPNYSPNVLIVEDNRLAQEMEKSLLMALHCHVDTATTGKKALRLFKPGRYDVVFMDIGLKNTSGYLLTKLFRHMEKETIHHVPIIALTSSDASTVQPDCEAYHMDGVLSKPLTSRQAEQIIQHYVHHKDVPISGLISLH